MSFRAAWEFSSAAAERRRLTRLDKYVSCCVQISVIGRGGSEIRELIDQAAQTIKEGSDRSPVIREAEKRLGASSSPDRINLLENLLSMMDDTRKYKVWPLDLGITSEDEIRCFEEAAEGH